LTKLNFEKALSQLKLVTGIVTKSDNVLKIAYVSRIAADGELAYPSSPVRTSVYYLH
jgi:hypothetical protein